MPVATRAPRRKRHPGPDLVSQLGLPRLTCRVFGGKASEEAFVATATAQQHELPKLWRQDEEASQARECPDPPATRPPRRRRERHPRLEAPWFIARGALPLASCRAAAAAAAAAAAPLSVAAATKGRRANGHSWRVRRGRRRGHGSSRRGHGGELPSLGLHRRAVGRGGG